MLLGAVGLLCALSGAGAYALATASRDPAPPPLPAPPVSAVGMVRFVMPPHVNARLSIDGQPASLVVSNGTEVAITPGPHRIHLVGASGPRCEQGLTVAPAGTTVFDCPTPDGAVPEPEEHLPPGKLVNLSYKEAPLDAVLRTIGDQCEVNVVIPDSIVGTVTVELAKVPCDQALEVILESRGLWYEYRKDGKLLRVAPRKQLDLEQADHLARLRTGIHDDVLPAGGTIDFDFKGAPLADLLRTLAKAGGVSVVIPDSIVASITIRAHGVPWDRAMKAVLAADGLWFRYRENGKVLRIAPRKQLDLEDSDAHARGSAN